MDEGDGQGEVGAVSTVCKRCQKRGKTWAGDDPKCWKVYGSDNWNCATLNELRDLVRDSAVWSEDQNSALIATPIQMIDEDQPFYIFVSWYKSRGHTETVCWMDCDGTSHDITFEEVERVLDIYAGKST